MWHAKINKQSTDKTHVYIFIEKKERKVNCWPQGCNYAQCCQRSFSMLKIKNKCEMR